MQYFGRSSLSKGALFDFNVDSFYDVKYNYGYCKELSHEFYRQALEDIYYLEMGRRLNLNFPKFYTEKIQWLKIYDNSKIKSQLTDKFLVRDWVKEKIGSRYLVPIFGDWFFFDDIDFDALPNKFVMKVNHSSNANLICRNKSSLNIEDLRVKFTLLLNENYAFVSGFELNYENIIPRIICEKYVENLPGFLNDYKVFCFHGVPKFIMISARVYGKVVRLLYDTKWKKFGFVRFGETVSGIECIDFPAPSKLQEMLDIASVLSAEFIHVRVDLYQVDNAVLFGEMTFYPGSGYIKFSPIWCDRVFGEFLDLSDL